jgi:hypothetical protein
LKSVEKITAAHNKQVQTYLRLTGCKLGYLLNFGEALMKNGITRCVNRPGRIKYDSPLHLSASTRCIVFHLSSRRAAGTQRRTIHYTNLFCFFFSAPLRLCARYYFLPNTSAKGL